MQFDFSDDAMLIAIMIALGFTSLNGTLATIFEAKVGLGQMATAAILLLVILMFILFAAVWEILTAGTGGGSGGD